eukprot:scaffold310_cov335-Pavlova_lutheri.AAC.82
MVGKVSELELPGVALVTHMRFLGTCSPTPTLPTLLLIPYVERVVGCRHVHAQVTSMLDLVRRVSAASIPSKPPTRRVMGGIVPMV